LFHPDVTIDITESFTWYNDQKSDLGYDFLKELESFYTKIEINPEQYTKIDKEIGFRACLLKRFPFKIIYKEYPDYVFVTAVAHTSRMPDFWKHRL